MKENPILKTLTWRAWLPLLAVNLIAGANAFAEGTCDSSALSNFATTVGGIAGPGGSSNLYTDNADGVRLDFTKTPTDVFGSASP